MTASVSDPDQQVVLITGPSGAGRSTAINVLEDLGFEVIDNLPISMVPRLLDGPNHARPLALGLDVRNRDFSPERVSGLMDSLQANPGIEASLLFVDARVDTLIRRYSETRRRHPLTPEQTPQQGIEQEVALLAPLRSRADVLIDTSDLSPHALRDELSKWFSRGDAGKMAITVESFSYKRGLPRGADIVWDCRFLNNPHWQEDLRAKTGQDPEVAAFVQADPRHAGFMARLVDNCEYLLPAFREEGKTHLAIALGCTGGRHRSVSVTEQLGQTLANKGWEVSIRHREMERQGVGMRGAS